MSHTSRDIYSAYEEEVGKLSYKDFMAVIQEFNIMAMEEIIGGGKYLNMGYHLSTLSIIRIERDFSNPAVNWKATNELKQELLDDGYTEDDLYSKDNPDGIKYFVYHTDEWYCRFYWRKSACRVKNKSAYAFRATRGSKGNKTKLKERLNNDDMAHLDYRLVKKD